MRGIFILSHNSSTSQHVSVTWPLCYVNCGPIVRVSGIKTALQRIATVDRCCCLFSRDIIVQQTHTKSKHVLLRTKSHQLIYIYSLLVSFTYECTNKQRLNIFQPGGSRSRYWPSLCLWPRRTGSGIRTSKGQTILNSYEFKLQRLQWANELCRSDAEVGKGRHKAWRIKSFGGILTPQKFLMGKAAVYL